MSKMPEISVVMSVHNHPERLDKTIKSVFGQSHKNLEFIIVDDGSADKEVLRKLEKYAKKDKRIKIIKNKKNIGLTKSLNKALKTAKGKYIARIDVGDLCRKDRLDLQRVFLEKNKDYALVGSWVRIVNLGGQKIGEIIYPAKDKEIRKSLIRTNPFAHSSLMIRHDVLKKEGYYNPNFRYSQDYELILRLATKYKVSNIKDYLISYLYDTEGISASPVRKEQDRFAMKARWLGLTKYGYPKILIFDFIVAFIEQLFPMQFKEWMLRLKKAFRKKGRLVIGVKGKRIIFDKFEYFLK